MRTLPILLFLLASACASAPPAPPASGTAPDPLAASSVSTAAVDAGTAVAEPEPEHKKQLLPVEVVNLCHDVALLAYGDPPNVKADSLGRFMGDATGNAERERDGTLPVTLVDDKGNALAKVHVSRRMKKLEIGRSCRTLYAH